MDYGKFRKYYKINKILWIKDAVLKSIKPECDPKKWSTETAIITIIANTSRKFTYLDLIKEIEDETEFGESFIEDVVKLTVWRLLKGIENYEKN